MCVVLGKNEGLCGDRGRLFKPLLCDRVLVSGIAILGGKVTLTRLRINATNASHRCTHRLFKEHSLVSFTMAMATDTTFHLVLSTLMDHSQPSYLRTELLSRPGDAFLCPWPHIWASRHLSPWPFAKGGDHVSVPFVSAASCTFASCTFTPC